MRTPASEAASALSASWTRCFSAGSDPTAGLSFWTASRNSSSVFWTSPRARESTILRRKAASRTPLTMPTPWKLFPLSSAKAPVPPLTQSGPLAWRTRFVVSGFFSLLHAGSAAAPATTSIAMLVLLPTRYLWRGAWGRGPGRFLAQTLDGVQLLQHRLVLREIVGLAQRLRRLFVVAGVFVGESEIPVC